MAEAGIEQHIGDRIRLRRTEQGLTQDQLAAALGVSYQQIQKYESGANRISAENLWRIAQRLDVTVEYFFLGYSSGEASAGTGRGSRARGTLELVRAFGVIKSHGVRTALTGLVRAVAERRG